MGIDNPVINGDDQEDEGENRLLAGEEGDSNSEANGSDDEEGQDQESIGSRIESEVKKYVESLFKKLSNEDKGRNRLLAGEEGDSNPEANASDDEEGQDQESIGSRIESEVKKYVESLFKKLQ